MSDKQEKSKVICEVINKQETEKTVIKSLGFLGGAGGGVPSAVDVKNGRIVRVRPLHWDWKYDKVHLNPWKFTRNGKTLEPSMKSQPAPYSLAYSKRALSPNRIKYPLKRVDWDPNGERNTQNRGISKYQRISWDEAAELVASELKRVQKQYGPFAVLAQADGHAENKFVHSAHGQSTRLLEKLGGYTHQVRNPDSWEGWYWGARHCWGDGAVGLMTPATNMIKDVTEHSEMLLFWGGDPETTTWGFMGQILTRLLYFWTAAGIKQVYICPELNYAAAVHADKWIPVLPNTDAALQLAIIYTWLNEGNFDKEYVKTHTVGMDKVADYVLGKEDGIPKTPTWASTKCGVPEWTIKALAREFASKTTSVSHCYGGSYIRGAYAHEPARLEVILLGMQGLGKPGVHQTHLNVMMMPRSVRPKNARFPAWAIRSRDSLKEQVLRPICHTSQSCTRQIIPKTLIQEAILNPPVTFWGNGGHETATEDQFKKYTYPIPKEEGGAEIHMMWTDSPCRTTCWNDGGKTIEAMRSPKIECIVAQHPWLENDCLLSDIILPSNTTFEEDDIMNNMVGEFTSVALQRQAIPPIGESKSDYEVMLEVAKKMGKYEEITEGRTIEDWIDYIYDSLGMNEIMSRDDFEKKGYYMFPIASDWDKDPAGMIKFYQDPVANPLPTPTGKLEFYSERLAQHFPDDQERPPLPKWIEKGESHDERLSSERANKYPLLIMSNHGRWRVHSQHDDISWTRECPTCKVTGTDGYKYEPLWINPQTAAARGIKSGDIVKIYNERGIVLGGAYVTERMIPGVAYMDHGSRCDWIVPGKVDRGGAINLISPIALTSKHCGGQATSGYLVEVEKVTMAQMEEWRNKYPEAFNRDYDAASGLRFNSWVIDENDNK
jgi:molybdopterin guanine dinucleotide-containing S/N-oxide reductase-like protein